jgi:hypothetical protein
VRRLTAEQFADAAGAITGEWNTYPGKPSRPGGVYAREWRVASSTLTRALGRPVRDQVTSVRASDASPLQALEMVNGESYTRRPSRGARALGELPPEPASLYNATFAGRAPKIGTFDVDVAGASTLWLLVQDEGSNAPERLRPIWLDAELSNGTGSVVALSSLAPRDDAGLRGGEGELRGLRVKNPSAVVHDLTGRASRAARPRRGRERGRRDRFDPESAAPLLHFRQGAEHGSADAAGAGVPLPAPRRRRRSAGRSIVCSSMRSAARRRRRSGAWRNRRCGDRRAIRVPRPKDWPICCGRSR